MERLGLIFIVYTGISSKKQHCTKIVRCCIKTQICLYMIGVSDVKRKSKLSLLLAVVMFFSVIPTANNAAAVDQETAYQALADEVIVIVNEQRMEEGLTPLKAVPILNDASAVRAAEIKDEFSHYRPNGDLFASVLTENKVITFSCAENIAAGMPTADDTMHQWMNSEGHKKNIMNPDYTHIGVGVYYDEDSTYGWYWSQIFIKSNKKFDGEYYPQRYYVIPECVGDINGDSEVDMFDYVTLTNYFNNKIIFNDLQMKSADCLADDVVSISDAVILVRYINRKCDTLPLSPDDL